MSTIAQLQQFRRQLHLDRPSRVAPQTNLRELWADALATLAMVALASTLVFEALRIVLP